MPSNHTYHHDALQSVVGLSGHAGTLEQTLRYGPFGEVLEQVGGSPSGLRFTGRELDAETGLYYYRARYYDPELGRFLSEDPLGLAGGDVNLYAYVGNNPLRFSDPKGLIEQHTQLSGFGRVARELADIIHVEASLGLQAGASAQFGPFLRAGVRADFGSQRLAFSNVGFTKAYTESVSFEITVGVPGTPFGVGLEGGISTELDFIPAELHRASYVLDRFGTQEAFLAGQLGPLDGQIGARIATDNTDVLVGGSVALIFGLEGNANLSEVYDAGRQAIDYASGELTSALLQGAYHIPK